MPALHNLDCRDCIKYTHHPDLGWAEMPPANGQRRLRMGCPPPCGLCEKKSPTEAWQYELSPRNYQAVRHYLRHRAMGFQSLSEAEKADTIVQRNFEIIDEAFRQHERDEAGRQAMMMIQAASSVTMGPTGAKA